MEFLSAHQLNIMKFMSGICGVLAFLSCIPGLGGMEEPAAARYGLPD